MVASPSPARAAAPWLIVGAGYTGRYLAARLYARGAAVTVTTRAAAAANALAATLTAATDDTATASEPAVASRTPIRGLAFAGDAVSLELARAAHNARVIWLAPPPTTLTACLPICENARHLTYLSATSVYGHATVVEEHTACAPLSSAGHARRAAELALEAACTQFARPLAIVRAAGIYGRGPRALLQRAHDQGLRVIGDGRAVVCRVHIDDLVALLLAVADTEVTGVIPAADDAPTPYGEVADAIAAALHRPAPPRIALDQVSADTAAMFTANRRIGNARMRHIIGPLSYPSWRTALAAELAAEAATPATPPGQAATE